MQADERSLEGLMQAAQRGDAQAYARLLKEITPRVHALVKRRRQFLSPADVEDLVQDVLMSLHAVRSTYDSSRPFMPWLGAIIRNRLADGARRYARQRLHEVNADDYPVTFFDETTNNENEGYGDPERLRQVVESLPPAQRRAIELLKFREMSLNEAAAASGTNVGALKVSVHRAMASLRRALGKE